MNQSKTHKSSYIVLAYSHCNSTHLQASARIKQRIQESLPQFFQDHLMCAGVDVGNQGACKGDSGGPLMYKDDESRKYIQIATVRGGVGDCGDDDYPGIFVRVDHPSVWKFISSTIKSKFFYL
jgi:secreted trypsin-like serine protease